MVLNTRHLNFIYYTHRWCYNIHRRGKVYSLILASETFSIPYLSISRTVSLSFTGLNLFDQGLWKELQDRTRSGHGNIHFTRLFEVLKQTALSSKACGTVVNYTSSLNRWIKFARDNNLVVFPVTIVDVALYFSYLSTSQVSASVIETSFCALKWIHDIAGVPNPMVSPFVRNVVEGAKRQNAKPVAKKSPISPEALTACCAEYEHSRELPIRRDISMALLLFAGFFRFNELAALAIQDISISGTHLTVKVTKSKTDQYRKGNEVVISRSGKVSCPVLNLERYMALAGINTSHKTSDYLFKPIVKVRSGYKVIEKVKPLSYTRARESIVGLLSKFVPATDIISLHSFRAGGATSAANAQVPDRCWKRHGRWQSETAKDGYVEDSLDNRLLVSQSLGI